MNAPDESRPSPCCGATRVTDAPDAPAPPSGPSERPLSARSTAGQAWVPGGTHAVGDHFDEGYDQDGEAPVHPVRLSAFWMDTTAVTNDAFAAFVRSTGYTTDAERYGTSAVFHLTVTLETADAADILGRAPATPWWLEVRAADWRHPEGRHSDIADRGDHPVVHVSWHDAEAYAAWAGRRLPTEAEWEFSARGGLVGQRFPWGNELLDEDGRWQCNIWQGPFPNTNDLDDGYLTTAPAAAFHRNGYGLWSMVGNVWEWCADWFSPTEYADRVGTGQGPAPDPQGPSQGTARVMRGGSFLCHDSYCYRYRVAARSNNTPDSSSSNIGFRCANDDAAFSA